MSNAYTFTVSRLKEGGLDWPRQWFRGIPRQGYALLLQRAWDAWVGQARLTQDKSYIIANHFSSFLYCYHWLILLIDILDWYSWLIFLMILLIDIIDWYCWLIWLMLLIDIVDWYGWCYWLIWLIDIDFALTSRPQEANLYWFYWRAHPAFTFSWPWWIHGSISPQVEGLPATLARHGSLPLCTLKASWFREAPLQTPVDGVWCCLIRSSHSPISTLHRET